MMGTYFLGRLECRAAVFLSSIVRLTAALLQYCFKAMNTYDLSENINSYVQVILERKLHIFVFAVCVEEDLSRQLTFFKTLSTLS